MSLDAIRDVIQRSRSTGATRLVLMVLAYHADRATGESYASRRLLAAECNTSTSTVHLALEELLAAGEIEILMSGSGRKATTYRICSDSVTEPLGDSASGSVVESLAPVDNPVDNSVVARSTTRSGSIWATVVARSARSPIRNRTEEKNKIEPQPATAASVDDDPTATAVVVHSPNGKVAGPLDPGLSEATRATLAAVKASIHDQLTADRQAERDRTRDLLGPPTTEPFPNDPRPDLKERHA